VVSYEGDVWPEEELSASRVRKPTKSDPEDLESFDPKVGDEVELRLEATDHSPAGWSAAVVKNIKHDFYFVARVSSAGSGSAEAIVEHSMLRPIPTRHGLEASSLSSGVCKVPAQLESWVNTPDASGCLSHIEEQTGLLCIKPEKSRLKLVGPAASIKRAQMLLEVHMKHQAQIQSFQDMREKKLNALEVRRNKIEGSGYKHSVEIKVDPIFIPRVIGKNGESIKALQEKYDVSIRILDDARDEDERAIRIFGNTEESIESARQEVEYIEEAIPIEPQMNSWILGRGGKTIQDIKANSGIFSAKLDRNREQLLICGTKTTVEDAVALFETHIMYYPVFSQMDEEIEQIITQLEEYGDHNARREVTEFDYDDPKGKGGSRKPGQGGGKDGRGKGKGKEEDKAATRPARTRGKGGGKASEWDAGDDGEAEYKESSRPVGSKGGRGGGRSNKTSAG